MFGNSGIRDLQVAADLPGQVLVYLTVTGDRRALADLAVHVHGVLRSLPKKLTPVLLEVPDEFPPLHAVGRGSLITS